MMRALFAGCRQLLQLSLFIDDEPANHDCCELVPEHLRLRQESRDLGFLAGVELLTKHECQVLIDGAERLVGGREAGVRRLWRSVAVGGSGGFGHRFPFKHPSVICRKISGVGWIAGAAELRASNPSQKQSK